VFKNGMIGLEKGLARFAEKNREIRPLIQSQIIPDWDRSAEKDWFLGIKLGTICLTCGCLSCDRTLEARKYCVSSEGGAAK